jgi:hypothetical protein
MAALRARGGVTFGMICKRLPRRSRSVSIKSVVVNLPRATRKRSATVSIRVRHLRHDRIDMRCRTINRGKAGIGFIEDEVEIRTC